MALRRSTTTQLVEADPLTIPPDLAPFYVRPTDQDVVDATRTLSLRTGENVAADLDDARRQLHQQALARARQDKHRDDLEKAAQAAAICQWCGNDSATQLPVTIGPSAMPGLAALGATPAPLVHVELHQQCRPAFQAALIARLAATVTPAASAVIDRLVQEWSPQIVTR